MDDRTNTTFGWILFSGIVLLGGASLSSHYFQADKPHAPHEGGYFIEGAAEEGGEDEGPALATLLANADLAAGEKIFAKCSACHTIEQGGANGIGPNLWGVLGKPIGKHAAGFDYSSALSDHGGDWSYENMNAWLTSPRAFASGTKMSFAGLGKPEDRANVMAYMNSMGGGPAFPEPAAPEPTEGEGEAPGAGPGAVEGAPADPAQAAGAMGGDQPVASDNAAGDNEGATKVD